MDSAAAYVNAPLKRLYGYLKPYQLAAVLALVSMAVVAVSDAAIPALLKPLIDQGFGGQRAYMLWLVPVLVVGLGLMRGGAQYASNYLLSWTSNRVLRDLRL